MRSSSTTRAALPPRVLPLLVWLLLITAAAVLLTVAAGLEVGDLASDAGDLASNWRWATRPW